MDCPEASFWCWVLSWFFALAIFAKMYLRSDDELIKIRVSTFREGDDFEQHATSQWPANPEHYDCQPLPRTTTIRQSSHHIPLPIVHLSIHPLTTFGHYGLKMYVRRRVVRPTFELISSGEGWIEHWIADRSWSGEPCRFGMIIVWVTYLKTYITMLGTSIEFCVAVNIINSRNMMGY